MRPRRHRYENHRQGFHEEFTRPQSAFFTSDIRSSWVDSPPNYPTISQELLDAFSAPVNSLEAVNTSCASIRKPERPSRAAKKLDEPCEATEFHDYSNMPHKRTKRLNKAAAESDSQRTWPRKDVEKPAVPRRLKAKSKVTCDYQTWPRNSPRGAKSPKSPKAHKNPPSAPKRCRSKNKLAAKNQFENDSNTQLVSYKHLEIIEAQIEPEPDHVILVHSVLTSEPDVIIQDTSDQVSEPLIPPKQRQQSELRDDIGDATWSRCSKPCPPRRSKRTNILALSDAITEAQVSDVQVVKSNQAPCSGLDELLQQLASQQNILEKEAGAQLENLQVQPDRDQQDTKAQETTNELEITDDKMQEFIGAEEEMTDEAGYAEIQQFQADTPPPRPPPPTYSSQSISSYSYIYPLPRRTPRTYHTISPERSPKSYCTLRPHRPPRKNRPRTVFIEDSTSPSETEISRRNSFSGLEDVKVERDLQDALIVEKMRSRPLPAPPRAKNQHNNNNSNKSIPDKPPRKIPAKSCDGDVESDEPVPIPSANCPSVADDNLAMVLDGYEPITTEEVSIGIQTDPLPEYEEVASGVESAASVADDFEAAEINNNYVGNGLAHNGEAGEEEPVRDEEYEQIPSMQEEFQRRYQQIPCIQQEFQSDRERAQVNQQEQSEQKEINQEPKKHANDSEDEYDSYSRIPANFPLPIQPLRFPTRLHLVELDVERLNVGQVQADRLAVSSLDANTLQVLFLLTFFIVLTCKMFIIQFYLFFCSCCGYL